MDIQIFLDRITLKPKSVKHVRDVLRNALNEAVEWDLIPKNPIRGVRLPKMRRQDPPAWTAGQLAAFFNEAKKHRLYAAFYLAATTGMRRGEIAELKWEYIDLERHIIHVRSQTKTDPSRRPITLSDNTVIVLGEHYLRQAAEKEKNLDYKDERYVFAGIDGKPVHPDSFTHLFTKMLKRVNLPQIPLHGLRHTMATLMLEAGVHPKIVAERLGHSDVRTTLNTYSHVMPTLQKEAAETIDRALENHAK